MSKTQKSLISVAVTAVLVVLASFGYSDIGKDARDAICGASTEVPVVDAPVVE